MHNDDADLLRIRSPFEFGLQALYLFSEVTGVIAQGSAIFAFRFYGGSAQLALGSSYSTLYRVDSVAQGFDRTWSCAFSLLRFVIFLPSTAIDSSATSRSNWS